MSIVKPLHVYKDLFLYLLCGILSQASSAKKVYPKLICLMSRPAPYSTVTVFAKFLG
jgi:hypothetical protein